MQLLCEQPEEALRSARFAVKLNPQDPQARINLSLALLETDSKGVRDHIQVVQQVLTMAPQISDDLKVPSRTAWCGVRAGKHLKK